MDPSQYGSTVVLSFGRFQPFRTYQYEMQEARLDLRFGCAEGGFVARDIESGRQIK